MSGDDSILITDAQWAAAKEAFYEMLEEKGVGKGMPLERYELILSILKQWDVHTPAERREMSTNAYFWYSKYKFVISVNDDDDTRSSHTVSKHRAILPRI